MTSAIPRNVTVDMHGSGWSDQGPAALPDVRLGGRRQVHPDRPSALRHQADSRGPAGWRSRKTAASTAPTGDDIDLALLVDGLEAEREQGITIDVAYRFFSTPRRSFIVADTPGHEQYTRNMATGASNSDAAVILIDARKGVLTQTRRHSYICSLLGIRHVAVAVNKIDLVEFSGERFHHIMGDYFGFAQALGFASITPIPLSARYGDNVTARSDHMRWYDGPTLLEYLEGVEVDQGLAQKPFRFPVQWVNRPNLDFRGFSGTVASGTIHCRRQDRRCRLGQGVRRHSHRDRGWRSAGSEGGRRRHADAGR